MVTEISTEKGARYTGLVMQLESTPGRACGDVRYVGVDCVVIS